MSAVSDSERSITAASQTDTGRVRDHNEDSCAAHPELGLWLVADGMGGASSGEVASALVVKTVRDGLSGGGELVEAIAEAHRAIHAGVAEGRGGAGMGSTVVALRIGGNQYEIAWVGDSRAYRFDGDELRQLSRDHSFVQALVEQGAIGPDEADHHPARHILTRVLGGDDPGPVEVERITGRLTGAECFLLCSDGLTDELSDDAIAAVLRERPKPDQAARALVAAAIERGGHDNVTVMVVCVA